MAQDEDVRGRARALSALQRIAPRDEDVVSVAIRALGGPEASVRVAALDLLAAAGPAAKAATPALLELLRGRDPLRVRVPPLLVGLGEYSPAIVAALERTRDDDPASSVRSAAAGVLPRFLELRPATERLASPDAWVRVGAVEDMGREVRMGDAPRRGRAS